MVEIFIRKLEAMHEGQWLTICMDLRSGVDLSNIEYASVRLNDCAELAAQDVSDGVLHLTFRYRDVRAFVGQCSPLILTGRFSDGVELRGTVNVSVSSSSVGMRAC